MISLRSDSGRLSLESVLTGTALWLAILYLMQDAALAAGTGPEQQTGNGGGGGGGGDFGGGVGRGGDGDGGDFDFDGGGGDFGGGGDGGGGGGGGDGGGNGGVRGLEDPGSTAAGFGATREDSRQAIKGPEPPAAVASSGGMAGDGGMTADSGTSSGDGPERWIPPEGSPAVTGSAIHGSSAIPATGSGAGSADQTRWAPMTVGGPAGEGTTRGDLEPKPEIPGLRVVLRSTESIVSRSVEGPASTDFRNTLGAISDAVIDLRDVVTPKVLVSSDRELHLLALSVLNDADLAMASDHTGLKQASLLFGPEANDIRLQVSDAIDLGLVAGGAARGQIHQSLIGMLDSHLQDSGAGAVLNLSSLARFLLKAPGDPLKRQLGVDLLAQAMQNSTILLGDGNDVVTIASGFRDLDAAGPGLLIDIPTADAAANDPSLQLRTRALGLVNSTLQTGGGNDQVSIATWLDRGDSVTNVSPTNLRRIALLDSTLLLGDGNDQLKVSGAVIGSRLDLGTGDNQLDIDGEVQDLNVSLGRDSSNRISLLGVADDSLTVSLAPGAGASLYLQSGGGNDQIKLPYSQVSGRVDGGGGVNTLEDSSPAVDQDVAVIDPGEDKTRKPLQINLDSAGEGTVGSLAFTRIDNLRLGPMDATVSVAARGELGGTITASGGQSALDYSGWQAPVQVDLGQGKASGILGGITGFKEVLGGSGNDQLTAGADSLRIDGGPGDDTIQLNLASGQSEPGAQVFGGEGRDTFVLSGLVAIQAGSAAGERALPALADLKLENTSSGGIGLTDTLRWRQEGIQTGAVAEESTITLTPSGLEGLGQPRLVPIAPLEQLLAGIHATTLTSPQLAIAAGATHSSLLLVGADGSYSSIAALPTLQLTSSPLQNSASGTSQVGVAA
ncbi:MAG: hypothetical protein WAM11_06110 [Cyanobium sp.]